MYAAHLKNKKNSDRFITGQTSVLAICYFIGLLRENSKCNFLQKMLKINADIQPFFSRLNQGRRERLNGPTRKYFYKRVLTISFLSHYRPKTLCLKGFCDIKKDPQRCTETLKPIKLSFCNACDAAVRHKKLLRTSWIQKVDEIKIRP